MTKLGMNLAVYSLTPATCYRNAHPEFQIASGRPIATKRRVQLETATGNSQTPTSSRRFN